MNTTNIVQGIKASFTAQKLYPYQARDLEMLFKELITQNRNFERKRLLYQLPTGGGKTTIFAEIAKRFIAETDRQVMVLTHRKELCRQTSRTLTNCGIANKTILSDTKRLRMKNDQKCFVAMVETLKNRIEGNLISVTDIGLLIIDEAHHNSFNKLLDEFPRAHIIGVTATPLSSNAETPMHQTYEKLIVGEKIQTLIADGYLAKPKSWYPDVELNSLQTGEYGDFTTSSSDELYSSPAMLDLLLESYEAHAKGKKTLIFNTGIFTSKNVCRHFEKAGYAIRHLDNHTKAAEREEILKWFKKTKGALLTSVSVLTTGFDEPTIQTVILNRATTSLTLYHQMIGRGSRILPKKRSFGIIDLGNNITRFGPWEQDLDWQAIFADPDGFTHSLQAPAATHTVSSDIRAHFPKTLQFSFDVQDAYRKAIENDKKPGTVIRDAIRQHAFMCLENSQSTEEALALVTCLKGEISWRVKQYGKCLGKATKNYLNWLEEDYIKRLMTVVRRLAIRYFARGENSLSA